MSPKAKVEEEIYAVVWVEGCLLRGMCLLSGCSTEARGPGFDLRTAGRSYCTDSLLGCDVVQPD